MAANPLKNRCNFTPAMTQGFSAGTRLEIRHCLLDAVVRCGDVSGGEHEVSSFDIRLSDYRHWI